jgi:hypothetical protein
MVLTTFLPALLRANEENIFMKKLTRRQVILGAVATSAIITSPRLALAGVTLTPDPSGDDWTQVTAAFSTLRSSGSGWVEFYQPGAVPFNLKKSVDGTGLGNADIRFSPGTTFRCDGFTGDGNGRSAPMMDFSNSFKFSLTGEGSYAGLFVGIDGSSPSGTVIPNCPFLISNVDTKGINNLSTEGSFSSASVAIVCCSDVDVIGGAHVNRNSVAPVLMISSNPDFSLWSPYSTFPAPNTFVNDIFVRTRMHALGGQFCSIYLRNSHNIMFEHCLMDNNCSGGVQILAQTSDQSTPPVHAVNDEISIISGKSYSELGVALGAVVECQSPASCTNLKMVGFGNAGIPNTIGTGNFAGLQVI